jgi:myo-inositol 2-dehydrogenase / D-chiro-inositol 1-dehydrogenase
MTRAPIGVAVAGVGRIGRMHAELLTFQVPGMRLRGVQDLSTGLAREVGGQLGVPVAPTFDELLALPGVDAVAICSSTDTHAELVVEAARAGKAIFCEKPVSLELAELDRALAAASGAGVVLHVGFNRRFDPAHEAVRDAVAGGTIGEPHLVRISSRDPAPPPLEYARASGGLFLDMTIHDFDMARHVTGSEVVEVYARGALRIEPALARVGDVDTAVITLTHENGCLTVIDNSRQAVYGYDQRVEAFGSLGMAMSDNPPAHTTVVRTQDGTRATGLAQFFLDRYAASYARQWTAFADALRDGAAPPVTGEDARAALVLGLASGRSLREGRPVAVAEVDEQTPAQAQARAGGADD